MASIRKRGDSFTITAYMGYDAKGKQIKKTTTYRPPDGVTAGKAEKLAKAYAATWEEKIKGFVALDENRTFAELADWYYKSVAPLQLKPNVLIDNRTMINTYVMPTLARKKLKDINPAMLDTLFADIRKNGRVKDTYRLQDGFELPKGKRSGINISKIASETGVARRSVTTLGNGGSVEKTSAEKISSYLGVHFNDMFVSDVDDRSLSESSVSRIRRCLSAIFTAAVRKEIMRRNPVSNTVALTKKSSRPVSFLTETQAIELVTALEKKNDFQFKVMINTLLFTGMRGGELCGLQWQDIDIDKGIIYIRHTLVYVRNEGAPRGQQKDSKGAVSTYELQSPKTAAGERYVIMPSSLLELLKEYKQQQDEKKAVESDTWNKNNMVFLTASGNYYGEQYLNAKFKRLIRKIGLPQELHLHSLRHTTASLLINSDISPKLIADQLGHASASITQDIYSHIFQSSKARAAQALEITLAPKNG